MTLVNRALVLVMFVNTPVLGVDAPIGLLSIVPPEIVRLLAILLSPSDPVMEPNEPSAKVTPALPSVPESSAVAETCPVASIVNPGTTIASVIELLGRFKTPITARLVVVALIKIVLVTKRFVPVADVQVMPFPERTRAVVPVTALVLL